MPAKIAISAGSNGPEAEVWIERPFLKVGTAASNDIRLPPSAGPAGSEITIYIQFRDGRYEIFNKDCDSATIDSRMIPRGESVPWPPRGTLGLGGGVEIELVVEGDPAPAQRAAVQSVHQSSAPRPAAAATRPAEDAIPSKSASSPPAAGLSGRQIAQLGVTAACLIACMLMVTVGRDAGTAPHARGDDFDRLVADGLSEPASGNAGATDTAGAADTHRRLTRRLQAAEAAYLVGDVNVAISRYGQIKRWLDPGRGEWSAESPDAANAAFLHRVAAFVDSRIAALAKSSHAH